MANEENNNNCNHEEVEAHTCPYSEEINNDYETLCTCCPCQERECSMDI